MISIDLKVIQIPMNGITQDNHISETSARLTTAGNFPWYGLRKAVLFYVQCGSNADLCVMDL